MKPKNLETRHYRLLWGNLQGRGTFIIERVSDGHTTLRFTGSEALEAYHQLLRKWNISGGSFDAKCSEYEYTL